MGSIMGAKAKACSSEYFARYFTYGIPHGDVGMLRFIRCWKVSRELMRLNELKSSRTFRRAERFQNLFKSFVPTRKKSQKSRHMH